MQISVAMKKHGKAKGFTPDYFAESVRDINFAELKRRGIRCLVLDVDHTLTMKRAVELPHATINFLNQQRQNGNLEAIFLASNSRRDLTAMAESIGAKVIRAGRLRRKPSRAYQRRVLKATGYQPSQSVMVGDKLVNDIWGGNRAGMHTILVPPIGPDLWFDRLIRRRFWGQRYLRKQRHD